LTVAVEFGVFAACLTFIYHISSLSRSERLTRTDHAELADARIHAWRLYGALFFGATQLVEQLQDHLPPHTLVLDLKNVIYVDSTGAEALEHLVNTCRKHGVRLIVCGLLNQPRDIATRTGLLALLAAQTPADVQPDVAHAVRAAAEGLGQ
jgi:SulP family sulfate permease